MIRAHRLYLLLFAAALSSCTCGKQPPPKASLLKEGSPCTTDESCETGLCDGPGGINPKCVRKCATGCTVTEVCTQLTEGRFACQIDPRGLCKPCQQDSDCPYPSDHCLVVNGENVCGRDCAFDQSCPTGYQCVNGKGVDGMTKIEQCTPKDASCSCLARGDFNQPCNNVNSFGSCPGKKACDLVTNDVVCDAPTPQAEVCNNADDNCDGHADEGLGDITCGVGACARTASACTGGDAGTCTPGMPTSELCNSIDDDCDGMTDEDFNLTSDLNHCGSCTNVCNLPHANPMCMGGTCKVASCQTNFGDCNMIDSDGCETPTDSDPNNCGGCGNKCVQTNSTATCVGGMCQFMCAAGWVDLDGNPANGCEYQCTFTSTTDVPDLMLTDANCDGIDGELNNGIFVSMIGNDSNPGTRASPVATLAKATALLTTTGKRDIYLAGTGGSYYDGPLELLGVSGVNVAGGYDQITWKRALTTQTTIHGGNPALKLDGSSNVLIQALRFDGADGVGAGATAYAGFIRDSNPVKLESLQLNAGNGAPGSDGTTGSGGSNGVQGGAGDPGCVDDIANIACVIQFGNCSRPAAGTGGAPGCGNFTGGTGGQPTRAVDGGTGDPGLPAPNGSGAGGNGVPNGKGAGPAGAPYDGKAGQDGAAGSNGPSASTTGSFTSAGFLATAGQNGVDGVHGKAGGGGGGGGGAQLVTILWTCDAWGSGGGGGGGAGCAGLGGLAGLGGGGSIGLFLSNSTVSAQSVSVKAGNGGKGGNGGAGGTGGTGGPGGTSQYSSDQGNASIGGLGGRGGNGGNGGNGGAGAGGSVYGLAKSTNSTWNAISGTSFTLGTAGTGGTALSGNGVNGASSIQTTW